MAQIFTGVRDPLLLSPPIPVEWAGFTSDTRRMQVSGWEFRVDAHPHRFERVVIAKHRLFNTVLHAMLQDSDLERRAMVYGPSGFQGFNGPPLVFQRAAHPESFHLSLAGSAPEFVAVDMMPLRADLNQWTGRAIDLFRPWAPNSEEIIVEPETVADLFEKIKKLQTPELAAIRERNRTRDYCEQRQEQVVAQIITLAA